MSHSAMSHAHAQAETVSFADLGLDDKLVSVLSQRGLTTPFPIQAQTIPDALSGRDILGRGRTGSGKTLSFGLPLVSRLAGGNTKPQNPRGLVLVPTRELAVQVSEALEPYAKTMGLSTKVVCGGMSMPKQIEALRRRVDILVATPGRLTDLIKRRSCSLDEVEVVVLDEADQMADMGFLPEVSELLDKVPDHSQGLLFSATLDRGIDTLVKKYLNNPATHSADPQGSTVSTMAHHVALVQPDHKVMLSAVLAATGERTIAFVRTQLGCDRVANQFKEAGLSAEAIHGGLAQAMRTKTLAEFKEGTVRVLVATDVAARGIHVEDVDLVLHIDPAGDSKDYLHRAGRTARAGKDGVVITLALPHQRRSTERLLDKAGAKATYHTAKGVFSESFAKLSGARSIGDLNAAAARLAVDAAKREVVELHQRLERAQAAVIAAEVKAENLTKQATEEIHSTPRTPHRNHTYSGDRNRSGGGYRSGGAGGGKRHGSPTGHGGHKSSRGTWNKNSDQAKGKGPGKKTSKPFHKRSAGASRYDAHQSNRD